MHMKKLIYFQFFNARDFLNNSNLHKYGSIKFSDLEINYFNLY